jgi:hypothetical protein
MGSRGALAQGQQAVSYGYRETDGSKQKAVPSLLNWEYTLHLPATVLSSPSSPITSTPARCAERKKIQEAGFRCKSGFG